MRMAPTTDDDALESAIRTAMLAKPVGTRQLYLRETELGLDGYGGERNKILTDRIRAAIHRVSASLGGG
jgi:hypothetical protein